MKKEPDKRNSGKPAVVIVVDGTGLGINPEIVRASLELIKARGELNPREEEDKIDVDAELDF